MRPRWALSILAGLAGCNALLGLEPGDEGGSGGGGAATFASSTRASSTSFASPSSASASSSVASATGSGGAVGSGGSGGSVATSGGAGGTAPLPISVVCGNETASTPCPVGEACCFNDSLPAGYCAAPGGCTPGDFEYDCDSSDDCPGAFCCGTTNGVDYTSIKCAANCDGGDELQLCDAMTITCANGQPCAQSAELDKGYFVCGE